MPIARFQMPDGRVARFEVPDGTTPEQAQSMMAGYFAPPSESQAPSAPDPSKAPSVAEKIGMGIADPIHGGAQLLTHVLPEGVVDAGNKFNNWLADKTGLVAKLPERNLSSLVTGQKSGVDALVAKREADYQAKRAAAGETGFDGWRTGGNFVSGFAVPTAGATTAMGRFVAGAVNGAVGGGLAPVSSGDFWSQKSEQVLGGAAQGGAIPGVLGGASRAISPKASTNPAVAKLRSEGITPTAGQILGGAAARTEEKLSSLPLVGDAIINAKTRAAGQLNRAVANRALSPVGVKLPEGMAGRDAVEFVGDTLGKKYDELLPGLTVKADREFADSIASLTGMVRNGSMDPKYANAFDRYMRTNVLNKFKGQNTLTGQTAKDIESDLGQTIARYSKSQDPDAQLYADALKEVQSNLRGLVSRSNPQASKELKAINTGYANFKRMERAAAGVGAEDGVFSPAQLQTAVKALDRSKDKRAFSRGAALMQDLSDPAKAVLGSKVPNSGTADRSFMALATLLDPKAAAMALTAPVLYSQPGQRALAGLLASRPQGAQAAADALRQASPRLGLLGGQVFGQLGLD